MKKQTLAIEIKGGSGSGKTHMAMLISEQLLKLGFNVEVVDGDVIDAGAHLAQDRLHKYLSSEAPQNTLVMIKTFQQRKSTQAKET